MNFLSDSLPPPPRQEKMRAISLSAYLGQRCTVRNITLPIYERSTTAIIGSSGSGKSALLRCLNRMHELLPDARISGDVLLDGASIYGAEIEPELIRRRVALLFPIPHPFPTMSIRENVLSAPHLTGIAVDEQTTVERTLQMVGLWDTLKDRLDIGPQDLSIADKQRLCLARALALSPDLLLLDDPCSDMDARGARSFEELLFELKNHCAIVLVTASIQQAARVSDLTAFMQDGELVEFGESDLLFTRPSDGRTEDYITGRFG